jgi:FkbM family methyltransferase
MNQPAATPGDSTNAPDAGVRRRDVVIGSVTGLLGLGGGAIAGRLTASRPIPGLSGPESTGGPAFPADASPTYAQCGEDVILLWLVKHLQLEKPSYMDIGCWEPVRANNTYLLYERGGRGLLVEPNPSLADRIRQLRPEDTLLSAGIGISDATEADYYMFNEPQLNTFDPEQVKLLARTPNVKLEKTVKVPLVNINRAIAERMGGKAPDILSIDIEGLDLAVLKTLDFAKYRPKIICAETLVTTTWKHNPETTPFMEKLGYEVRGLTLANTFYVDRKFFAG